MRLILAIVALVSIGLAPASAQSWSEPPKGSKLRADLMDAVRPHAEWMLGVPVEFVIGELRQTGDLAFAFLEPQRPGGHPIELAQTPMVQRDDWDIGFLDGAAMQVLFRKSGDVWVAVHWEIGATDVWFSWEPICREYRPVISDYCQ